MKLIVGILALTMGTLCAAGVKQEIKFQRGESSATLSGGVLRGDRDHYTLGAGKGQYLTVTVTSPERNAVFDVYEPGYKLDQNGDVAGTRLRNAAEAVNTTAELPASGRYLIVVGGTRGNAEYKLSVTIGNKPPAQSPPAEAGGRPPALKQESSPTLATTNSHPLIGSWICNESGEDRPTQFFGDGTFMVYSEQQRGHQLFTTGIYALQDRQLEMASGIGRLLKLSGEEVLGWNLSTHGRTFEKTNFRWFTYSVSALTQDRMDRTRIKATTGPGETETGTLAAAHYRVRSEPTNCRRAAPMPSLESQRQTVPPALYAKLRAVVALGNNKGPLPYPQAQYDIGALALIPVAQSQMCARQIQPWISAAIRLLESGEKLQKLGQQASADNLFRQASEIADDKIRRAREFGCQ